MFGVYVISDLNSLSSFEQYSFPVIFKKELEK